MAFALGAALLAATFAAHFPATHAGFIWDDDVSLLKNPLIASPEGLYKFWFTLKEAAYWPITSTVLWIEWRTWGNNPAPYHTVSILLHCLSAVLLWRVLLRLNISKPGSFLAATFFAIHPVTVESVAWISELKNVLSMALSLLAVLAYLHLENQTPGQWYVLALLAGCAAMLAKSSVVMLPIMLLICVWWRHSRATRLDYLRVLPFFGMSLAQAVLTIWTHHYNAIAGEVVRPEGLASRIAAVGWVVWFYLYKLIVPINLAMIYPRWDIDGGCFASYVPLALLLACFAVLWYYRNNWGRAPLMAFGAFVVLLAPVLGLLDMSYARYSLVADHLQYPGIPAIAAFVGGGIGAAWTWALQKRRHWCTTAIAATTVAITLAAGILTWRQAQTYYDSVALWTHTLAINDRAYAGHNNLGSALLKQNKLDQAIASLTKSVTLKPNFAGAYYNRGNAYRSKGDFDHAIEDYSRAIELQPDYSEAFNNRGTINSAKGDVTKEIQDFSMAIKLKPDNVEAYYNRGVAYTKKGNHIRAIEDFTRVTEFWPGYAAAYANRATEYYGVQQYDKAWADVNACRQLGGTISPSLLKNLTKATGAPE